MPNTLTIVFTSNPSAEPVEFPHPNTGVYVTGTQQANGTWQVVFTGVTKGTYAGLTGRLKNFPAVSATIAASGPVLNNVLATPTGTAATGTSSGTINVTVSSISNQTGYRLLAADTATGPFTQIYQGTTASFPQTGLTASQTKYYRWQYVGGGFYDDSALSAVFSGSTTATGTAIAETLYVITYGNSQTFGVISGASWTEQWQAFNPAGSGIVITDKMGNPGATWTTLLNNLQTQVLSKRDPAKRQLVWLQEFTNTATDWPTQKPTVKNIVDQLHAAGFLVGIQAEYFQRDAADGGAAITAFNATWLAERQTYLNVDVTADVTTSTYFSPLVNVNTKFIYNDNLHFQVAGDTLTARMIADATTRLKNGTYAGEVVPSTYVLPAYQIPVFNVGTDGNNTSTTFAVTNLTPIAGPPGTIVSIEGTALGGCVLMSINGASGGQQIKTPYVQSLSNSRINFIVPQGVPSGSITMYIITNGTSGATIPFSFMVQAAVVTPPAPAITSFTPASAAVGNVVTVTGTGFISGTTFKVGTVAVATLTLNSTTQATITVPAGAVSATISATNSNGTGTSGTALTVAAAAPADYAIPTAGLFLAYDTKAANYAVDASGNITSLLDTSGNNRHAPLTVGYTPATLVTSLAGFRRSKFTGTQEYLMPYPTGTDFSLVIEVDFTGSLGATSTGALFSMSTYSHMFWFHSSSFPEFYTGGGQIVSAQQMLGAGTGVTDANQHRRFVLTYRAADGRLEMWSDGVVMTTGTGAAPAQGVARIGRSAELSAQYTAAIGRIVIYSRLLTAAEQTSWAGATGV